MSQKTERKTSKKKGKKSKKKVSNYFAVLSDMFSTALSIWLSVEVGILPKYM